MEFTLIFLLLNLVTSRPHTVASFRHAHPFTSTDWYQAHPADSDISLEVSVALSLGEPDRAIKSLISVSDPESPNYGKYWTSEAVARTFKPAPSTVAQVLDWVQKHGIDSTRASQSRTGHVRFTMSVDEASQMLQTEFFVFKNPKTGDHGVACQNYNIPRTLTAHIDYITATASLATIRPRQQKTIKSQLNHQPQDSPLAVVDCNKYTSPSCLRDFYGIPKGIDAHPNNSFGIFQPSWQTWLPGDLDKFFKLFQPELIGRRPVMELVDGGYTQHDFEIPSFNTEPSLDFEYAMAIAAPHDVIDVQVGDKTHLGNLNLMLAGFDKYYCELLDPSIDPIGDGFSADCGTVSPPSVLSVSYAWSEAEFPPEYLHRQCMEFLRLGLMGITVVVSVSDFGTASGRGPPGFCIDNETGENNSTHGKFSPSFPSSCPWVTAVGGTQRSSQALDENDASHEDYTNPPSETVFNCNPWENVTLSSGGGFSNKFATPWYQVNAVGQYHLRENEHLSSMAGRYSLSGRGFPDVAVQAYGYLTVIDDQIKQIHGSSGSTPVFASIVTMINDERLKVGKGPVGFINPALYANSSVLNDVTTGANEGCGVNPAFQATEGWDAVTGLGSPNYERMRDYFMALP